LIKMFHLDTNAFVGSHPWHRSITPFQVNRRWKAASWRLRSRGGSLVWWKGEGLEYVFAKVRLRCANRTYSSNRNDT
jgi:hypothetical protein